MTVSSFWGKKFRENFANNDKTGIFEALLPGEIPRILDEATPAYIRAVCSSQESDIPRERSQKLHEFGELGTADGEYPAQVHL